jgi:hypothetical protein
MYLTISIWKPPPIGAATSHRLLKPLPGNPLGRPLVLLARLAGKRLDLFLSPHNNREFSEGTPLA